MSQKVKFLVSKLLAVILVQDAITAYKEAFSTYRGNIANYLIYSLVFVLIGAVLSIALFAVSSALLILFGGSTAVIISPNNFSLDAMKIAMMLLVFAVLGLGTLAFMWLSGGAYGAYVDACAGFISGKKPNFSTFFGAMKKTATPILILAVVEALCISIPLGLFLLLASFFSSSMPIVALLGLLSIACLAVVSVMFFFAIPAIVVDKRSAFDAIRVSFVGGTRNIVSVVLFAIIALLLSIPALIPLYMPFIFLPLIQTAYVILYKKTR